ncbi:DUF2147 domain-containing protein [Sphingomonas sp.]|uniref:DUF2147 domain-containing protein n=1 Tax=Sphingomonas sp. TaxID=28214 RepID=UPI0025EE8451|nr:DUF2147 domain-containing protein [Sphingomonas sp.]
MPLLIGAAAPPAAPGIRGEWRNTNNTVHMRLQPCGAALCGTVTWAAAQQRADARKGSGKELVGSTILHDLKADGDATWRGKVFIPDINTNASGTVVQVSDILIRVSGCTMLGLLCKTQHWHRIG